MPEIDTRHIRGLEKALATETILKRMKKSVNRDAALVRIREAIAILSEPGVSVIIGSEFPPPEFEVDLPIAPTTYTVPGGATSVSDSAGLVTQLATSPAKDIVCQDGTYTRSGVPFVNSVGHRVYAANLGGAVFTAGFSDSGTGSLYRGLAFDVTDISKTLNSVGAIIYFWGGQNHTVQDCTFDGNDLMNWAVRFIFDNTANGAVVQRLNIHNFLWDGVRFVAESRSTYQDAAVSVINTISDLDIDYIKATTVLNGTGEFGLWLECPVLNPVTRLRIRRCGWGCINTLCNSWDTDFEHLTLMPNDGTYAYYGTALYLEHYNQNNTFSTFDITGAGAGGWGEWADPGWGGFPAMILPISFSNGRIDGTGVPANNGPYGTGSVGLNFDGGNPGPTLSNIEISNCNWAAIGDHFANTSHIIHSGLNLHDNDCDYTQSHKSTNPPVPSALP